MVSGFEVVLSESFESIFPFFHFCKVANRIIVNTIWITESVAYPPRQPRCVPREKLIIYGLIEAPTPQNEANSCTSKRNARRHNYWGPHRLLRHRGRKAARKGRWSRKTSTRKTQEEPSQSLQRLWKWRVPFLVFASGGLTWDWQQLYRQNNNRDNSRKR